MYRLNSYGVSRAIGQPAHLLTWRQERLICEDCGQPYEVKIATLNGVDRAYRKRCEGCERKYYGMQAHLHALSNLQETNSRLHNLWWENSGIFPGKFANAKFDDFKAQLQRAAFNSVKKLAEQYCHGDHEEAMPSLVLLSPDTYGVGKTHLAAALVNYILDTVEPAYFKTGTYVIQKRPQPAFFTTESVLLSRIRATYNNGCKHETEEDIFHKMIHLYDVLIIDDLGKVRPRDYSFLQGVYFRIINGRYMEERTLMLTTNLNFTELENHIGGACADRLREMCGDNFIVMRGKSYRHD